MTIASGTATLVGGVATVSVPRIPTTAKILLTRENSSGSIGDLRHSAIVANTSFTIRSVSVLDTSTVHYVVMT